ncbi:MAG: protein phosphatase 2C domain-containing protein [Rhodocyclaceae bacterium]
MPFRVDACVAQHLGDRVEQQDRLAIFPHPKISGLLMAVLADGMGGHSGGAIAAEQVIHKARQIFSEFSPRSEPARNMLTAVLDESHLAIKLSRFTSEQDPHTTAALLLLQPGRVDWAHCGDSRIYHFRREKLSSRTSDHSYVAELQRQGKISAQQALNHPQRNVLLHCLGGDRDPRLDFGETAPLDTDDVFLMCSDGLWGHFSDPELGGVLALHSPRRAAEILIERARGRAGGQGDNISVAIVKLAQEKTDEAAAQPSSFARGHAAFSPERTRR